MPTENSINARLKLRTSDGKEVERLPDPPRSEDAEKPATKPATRRTRTPKK